MDSRLYPLFRSQFRPAEPVDTRQAIRRQEDPGGRGKQRDRQEDESDDSLWEDQTAVSIQSLRYFLTRLVTADSDAPAAAENIELSESAAGNADTGKATPQAQRAAQAAGAYKRAYRATHRDAAETMNAAAGPGPEVTLTAAETRTIHKLIEDLGNLADGGTETLTILKSDSFLQSLIEAVRRAQGALRD